MLTSGRHRKTKCSEERPQCSNCAKLNIECVWPPLVSSLPHGSPFEIRKLPKKIGVNFIHYGNRSSRQKRRKFEGKVGESGKLGHGKNSDIQVVEKRRPFILQGVKEPLEQDVQSDLPQNALDPHLLKEESEINKLSDNQELYQEGSIILCLQGTSPGASPESTFYNSPPSLDYEQNLDGIHYLNDIHLGLTPLSGNKNWIPGVQLVNNEPLFFHAFINGFIPSISPQYCHPQLTPMAIFVPQGIQEPMMRDVFYACGAAFVAHGNHEVLTVARQLYANCLTSFANRLSATGGKFEEWMVAAALLFTLRDKFAGTSLELPTSHLAKAVELLRILHKTGGDKSITLKFFVDSFLFNYSVSLITGGRLARKILPSPFHIFDKWRPIFEDRPFQCFVPWMNNPVFGAATQSFELAAKASWLVGLYPLGDKDMASACELLAQSYMLKLPTVSNPPKDLSARDFLRVQESVAVSEIYKLASQLLLTRLMHPTLELHHDIIAGRVQHILAIARTLSADTTLWIICSWLLLITGLCVVKEEDRKFIIESCRRAHELFRASFMSMICRFLEDSWGSPERPGPGWNHLFNEVALETFCF